MTAPTTCAVPKIALDQRAPSRHDDAGCGTERDAHSSGSFAHRPRPERVAEKVELKSRIVFTSTFISAIDDFRLVRMQRQSAISKSRLKRGPQRHGLVFSATVANRIIGIALERYVREVPAHPHIERIVKKEIRQEGADDPTLWRPSFSPDEPPVRHPHRGF